MRIENNVALVENRLLHDAIWGDVECPHDKKTRFTGYINANSDPVGRAFIEYCIARNLRIFRLPQCGYDHYTHDCNAYYAGFDEEMVLDACEELKAVMRHVQEQVKKKDIAKNGKVTVVRCLSDFQVRAVAAQLHDNKAEIKFPVSIFSSYSYDGDINQSYPSAREDHDKHINIKEDVDVDDIILWDEFVGDGFRHCSYMKSMHDDERELWVVDRSITGIKKLPKDCFKYTDGLPRRRGESSNCRDFGSDRPVYVSENHERPCERGDVLTKIIMKRNIRKIQNEESKIRESKRILDER